MKKTITFVLAAVLILVTVSCSRQPSEKVLQSYLTALQAYESQKLDQALQLAKSVQREAALFAPAFNLAGRILYAQGEIDSAIIDFSKAVELQKSSIDNRLWLARALNAGGRSEEVLLVLNSILTDNENNVAALRMLATAAKENDDAAESLYLLNQAISGQAEYGLVFMDRAELLWAAGKSDDALRDMRIAIELLPAGSALSAAAEEILQRMYIWQADE